MCSHFCCHLMSRKDWLPCSISRRNISMRRWSTGWRIWSRVSRNSIRFSWRIQELFMISSLRITIKHFVLFSDRMWRILWKIPTLKVNSMMLSIILVNINCMILILLFVFFFTSWSMNVCSLFSPFLSKIISHIEFWFFPIFKNEKIFKRNAFE
mgnify:CR=1 FL=1